MFLCPVLQFALLSLCWHNRRQLVLSLDYFNAAPKNSSDGNDWGTEEPDGGSPVGFAAIASHVTRPSKLTQTGLDISSLKSVKYYFHTDSASCEMLKEISSHNYAMHPLYCACNHTCQHYHFLPASFQCGSYGNIQRKFAANQITQLCFPSSMQHSVEVIVFLSIIIFGVVTNVNICFWSKSNIFSMITAMDPMQATSKVTYLIR